MDWVTVLAAVITAGFAFLGVYISNRKQAALAYIGTGAVVLGDVNWMATLSAGCFGFLTAVLLALTGLPEAEEK